MLSYNKKEETDSRRTLNRVTLVHLETMNEEQGNANIHYSTIDPASKSTLTPGVVPPVNTPAMPDTSSRSTKRSLLSSPWLRGALGILVGICLLIAAAQFVNVPKTWYIIRHNLTTTQGIIMTLLASTVFVMAFSFRAIRWKFFLNPVRRVSPVKIIQLFLIGVFLNFVLPIRAGELAKSLILKRISHLPFSQSLPTITMDKAMDLLPALFLIVLMPFLGIEMNRIVWSILGLANAGLVGLILFTVFTGWKRSIAIRLLQLGAKILPGFIRGKVEAFVISFVDTLLLSARRPATLVLAVVLTAISVFFDGLYNFFAFWAIGHPITITQALFGYMLYNLFYILPNPPGQVGSNEVVALLIFSGILHIPPESVTAMVVFFHAWSGLLMCAMGMGCLATLGISLSSTFKVQGANDATLASIEE